MRQLARVRLLIIVLVAFGLGLVPFAAGAQDIPVEGVEPPPDAGTASLDSEAATEEELSSIFVIKYVCPEIDEDAEDFCVGRRRSGPARRSWTSWPRRGRRRSGRPSRRG